VYNLGNRTTMNEDEIFAAVGEAGIRRIVSEFYSHVPSDPILDRLYPPHDLAGAEERLRDFLLFRLGGIPRYTEYRGHPQRIGEINDIVLDDITLGSSDRTRLLIRGVMSTSVPSTDRGRDWNQPRTGLYAELIPSNLIFYTRLRDATGLARADH
jgi:hypothetical protein